MSHPDNFSAWSHVTGSVHRNSRVFRNVGYKFHRWIGHSCANCDVLWVRVDPNNNQDKMGIWKTKIRMNIGKMHLVLIGNWFIPKFQMSKMFICNMFIQLKFSAMLGTTIKARDDNREHLFNVSRPNVRIKVDRSSESSITLFTFVLAFAPWHRFHVRE